MGTHYTRTTGWESPTSTLQDSQRRNCCEYWEQCDEAEKGVFFLTDTRCIGSELPFWKNYMREALGPRATILMAATTRMKGQTAIPKVGGCAAVINDYWGARLCDWFQDESGLGLVLGIYLTLRDSRILLMDTYWPVMATLKPGQTRDQ